MEQGNRLLLGQIALERGLVTSNQLEECLNEQATTSPSKRIGAIMVARGFLTRLQLTDLIAEQMRRMGKHKDYRKQSRKEALLGFQLVRARRVPALAVNEALRAQQDLAERGVVKPLGQILVDCGWLTKDSLNKVLAKKKKH